MWTADQRKRLALEDALLQQEGLSQFRVYRYNDDSYGVQGTTSSSSGRRYTLYAPIPSAYPYSRPPLYLIEPCPIYLANGSTVASLGVSHDMHTLSPHTAGWVQICHWREDRWHSNIVLQKVMIKGLLWIEAYEQHLASGRPLAEFVRTMVGTS